MGGKNKYKLALEFHISKAEAEPIEKNGAKRLNQQTDETINKKLVNDFEKRVNNQLWKLIRMEEIEKMGNTVPLINPTIELGIYFTTPFNLINNLEENKKFISIDLVDPITDQAGEAFSTKTTGGNNLKLEDKKTKELKKLKKLYKESKNLKKYVKYKNNK